METLLKIPFALRAGYAVAFGAVVGLKLLARTGEVENLLWLLSPTAFCVDTFFLHTGLPFVAGEGYFSASQNMVISAECAGVNFLIISFLSAVLGFLHKDRQVLPTLFLFACLAYVLTIWANTCRIITILAFEKPLQASLPLSSPTLHEGLGVFVYLSFLLVFYAVLHIIFKNPQS